MTVSVKAPTSTTGSIQLNGSDVLTIDSSGNLTAPYNFSVTGTITSGSIFVGDSHEIGNEPIYENLVIRSSVGENLIYASNLLHIWKTGATTLGNGTERMRIDSSGNVLVGSTSVVGTGKFQSANNSGYCSTMYSIGNSADYIQFWNGSLSSEVGSIKRSGGTGVSYNTSSDYRLKENVAPMSDSINRLKQLKPSTWSWVQDGSHGEGFLAHEAQEVVPEAVAGTKDAMKTEEYEVTPAVLDDDDNVVTEAVMGTREVPDYQGIDQSKLVPLLTAALQEAITKIEDLETRIQALEAK
jgi:hypothetical protein